MSEVGHSMEVELVSLEEAVEALRRTRPFAGTSAAMLNDTLAGVSDVERVTVHADTVLVEANADWRYYWLLLDGEINAERPEADGSYTLVGTAEAGEGFGETPILTGKSYSPFRITAKQGSLLIRFSDDDFWKL